MTAGYPLTEFIAQLIDIAEYEHGLPLEDLRLTKLELAKLSAEAVNDTGLLDCIWCRVDTSEIGEYYMVADAIWERYGPTDGCLCIGCLEDRMGRRLQPDDFKDIPLNNDRGRCRSERLRDRLGLDQPTLFGADPAPSRAVKVSPR
jgi:hypothetical protein